MDEKGIPMGNHRKHSRRSNGEGSIVKRKDSRYQASIMVNGKRSYFYSKKRSDCVNWLTEMRMKIKQRQPITEDVTVFEWGKHYIEIYAQGFVRPSTLANYNGYLTNHIQPHAIARVRLSKLTADQVQVFANELIRSDTEVPVKSHTQRNIMQFFKSMLECAVNNGLMVRNVAANVKLKKSDKKKRPILTTEDVQRLIQAADGHRWQIGIKILTEGLRISELLGLRHSNIIEAEGLKCMNITRALKRQYNFDTGLEKPRTELALSEPKTDSSVRVLPILPSIIDDLDKHMKEQVDRKKLCCGLYSEDPFIIATDLGEAVDPGNFRKFFIEAAEKAGIPSARPHDLRHFAASQMMRQGASPVGAAKILGDLPQTMLNVYCDENLAGKLDALLTLDDVTLKKLTQGA